MNVYDFDKTIFPKDSSAVFCSYCLRHVSRMVIQPVMPKLLEFFRYMHAGKQADASQMKEQLFAFLGSLPDPYGMVSDFWEENFSLIQPWYLAQARSDDVIISASPDFLVRPVAEKLGVSLIATPMDPFPAVFWAETAMIQRRFDASERNFRILKSMISIPIRFATRLWLPLLTGPFS